MNKKLLIVTTDMEIEMAMMVDSENLAKTKNIIEDAKEEYYKEDCPEENLKELVRKRMRETQIDFTILNYEEV